MGKNPHKRIVRTNTTISEEKTKDELPWASMVRGYLLEGADYPDELRAFQFKIKVYKWQPDNRAVLVTGRIFDNLEELPFELGSTFGTSRFRVYVTIIDTHGDTVAFIKLDDFPILWQSDTEADEAPGTPDDEEPTDDIVAVHQLEIEKLKLQQEHELRLKTMEHQNNVMIEALRAKGGGAGMKTGDILEVLKLGLSLGGGALPPPVGEDDASGDYLGGLLNSPLAAAIAAKLMEKNSGAPPAPEPVNDQGTIQAHTG